jgi:hypothetical protein
MTTCLRTFPLFVIAACAADVDAPRLASSSQAVTADPDRDEAETLAIEITDALVPDASLSERIATDLAEIRLADPTLAAVRARSPWDGSVFVSFDAAGIEEVIAGRYHAWDELNAEYGGELVYTSPELGDAGLEFVRTYQMQQLAELYRGLPNVVFSAPGTFGGPGTERADLCAAQADDGTLEYIFKSCSDTRTCRVVTYTGLAVTATRCGGSTTVSLGTFTVDRWLPDETPEPAWLTARAACTRNL